MRKRLTIATLCAATGIAALLFLLWGREAIGVSRVRHHLDLRSQQSAAGPSLPTHPSGEPGELVRRVSIEFDKAALSDVLNQLVKQAGITVTADLDDIHQQTMVSAGFNATPMEALQTIVDEYGLELLETDSGWWLRPVPPTVRMIYQPSVLIDEERSAGLFENLRKLIGIDSDFADNATPPAESISMDREGIHVTASKEKQGFVSAFLESYFLSRGGKVSSKSGELHLTSLPSLPQ